MILFRCVTCRRTSGWRRYLRMMFGAWCGTWSPFHQFAVSRRRRCRFRLCCQSTGVDVGMGKHEQATTYHTWVGWKSNEIHSWAFWGVYRDFDLAPCLAMSLPTDWKGDSAWQAENAAAKSAEAAMGELVQMFGQDFGSSSAWMISKEPLTWRFLKMGIQPSKLLDHFRIETNMGSPIFYPF